MGCGCGQQPEEKDETSWLILHGDPHPSFDPSPPPSSDPAVLSPHSSLSQTTTTTTAETTATTVDSKDPGSCQSLHDLIR